jgi:hypothetical protein
MSNGGDNGGDNGVTLRDVFLLLGETRGDVRAVSERVARVEADQSIITVACQDMGKQVAIMSGEFVRRGRRISEIERRLRDSENTGEIVIAREATRWSTLKWLMLALISAVAAAAGTAGTYMLRVQPDQVRVIKVVNNSSQDAGVR